MMQLYKQHFAADQEEDEDGDGTGDGDEDLKDGQTRAKRQVCISNQRYISTRDSSNGPDPLGLCVYHS